MSKLSMRVPDRPKAFSVPWFLYLCQMVGEAIGANLPGVHRGYFFLTP
jgi:hypothetical protein